MTPYELLERFQANHPDVMNDMRNADHNFSPNDLNPYHLEGDVWTHTMMVFNYAVIKNFPTEVLLAALLHDVGKAHTMKTREKPDGKTYVSFFGHDGVSYYRSLDILRESYADVLTKEQILTVAKLVANHSVLYSWQNSIKNQSKEEWVNQAFVNESDFLSMLSMLVEADSQGRITNSPSDVADYRKYRDHATYRKTYDETSPTLTLLVGPPASGKSTWVAKNATNNEVIISSDDILMEIGEGETYSKKWKNTDFKEVERIMNARFCQAVRERKNIIVDRTNMSKKSRRRFVSRVSNKYNVKAVVFASGHATMLERSEERSKTEGKFISDQVFHRMEMSFVYPLLNEVDEVEEVYELRHTRTS